MNEEFKSFLKTVEGNEGRKCHYSTRLDTYGCGCQHDCKYCYAKSLLKFRKLWDAKNPTPASIHEIRKAIKTLNKDMIIRLGGMTDCFQPLEKVKRISYDTIKALNEAGIGYLIVTKSAIIADDEYIEILDKDLAHIQITVTTLNDKIATAYEKASLPSERIKAIKKLQDNGFDVAMRISPFIPQFMDVSKLPELGIDKAIVEFLRVNSWIKKWFKIDMSEYTLNSGGYWHMPLERKLAYIKSIKGFKEISVCEDETKAYYFWKNHFNPNPNDCCNLRL